MAVVTRTCSRFFPREIRLYIKKFMLNHVFGTQFIG
jgi:hypothetical protein